MGSGKDRGAQPRRARWRRIAAPGFPLVGSHGGQASGATAWGPVGIAAPGGARAKIGRAKKGKREIPPNILRKPYKPLKNI